MEIMTHENEQKMVEAALAADREAALRDVFATAALPVLMERHVHAPRLAVIEEAFRWADAMLASRKGNV